MPKNPVIIIDGNNYAYRAYYAFARMKSRSGLPSAMVYGIPSFISTLINEYKPSKVLLVFDGNRHPMRMKLNPGYKGSRGGKIGFDADDFHDQKETVMELLHKGLGLPVFRNKGQEADDIIYKLVRSHSRNRDVIICSSDKDFVQLVNKRVSIWNHNKKVLVRPENSMKHFGYTPEQCVDYLVLDGDKSDGVPGYRGIGEAKAKEFLSLHSIKEFLDSDESFKGINKDKLATLYKLNKSLIHLPYFNRRFNRKEKPQFAFDSKPKISKEVIDDISIKYSTNSFRVKSFINKFKL